VRLADVAVVTILRHDGSDRRAVLALHKEGA